MVTLSKEEVQGLFDYLNDQPAKFSVPLMNFINGKIAQQQKQEEDEKKRIQQGEELQQKQNEQLYPQENALNDVAPFVPDFLPTPEEINDIEVDSQEVLAYDDPIDD